MLQTKTRKDAIRNVIFHKRWWQACLSTGHITTSDSINFGWWSPQFGANVEGHVVFVWVWSSRLVGLERHSEPTVTTISKRLGKEAAQVYSGRVEPLVSSLSERRYLCFRLRQARTTVSSLSLFKKVLNFFYVGVSKVIQSPEPRFSM